ncbi:hypothetical protein MLD38_004492 [Melastoma candidum]|uniref:Uncharacterized protein n=1 Tax=Melastoma candidum TaxID=119954 RepID=A0ACB9S6N8_9MYRT|nr:hypothetical protein MLD38_004492 [Melastoma candidum]
MCVDVAVFPSLDSRTSRKAGTLDSCRRRVRMPHKTRPMAALVLFIGLNAVLVSTIEPVSDFVCFLPFWERRREHRRQEREAALLNRS